MDLYRTEPLTEEEQKLADAGWIETPERKWQRMSGNGVFIDSKALSLEDATKLQAIIDSWWEEE